MARRDRAWPGGLAAGLRVTASQVAIGCTTVLSTVFLPLAAALVTRFPRPGGGPMLRMMGGKPPGDGC